MQAQTIQTARILGPTQGRQGDLGSIGVRFMIPGTDTEGRFSLVEHPMPVGRLAAPLHRHNREDEYSFVLEGRMGALLGDEVVYAEVGDLVWKPRGQWHTFWNAGDTPARILELISPSGFEDLFGELLDAGGLAGATPELFASLCERYALDMDPSSVPGLEARFGVTLGPPQERPGV